MVEHSPEIIASDEKNPPPNMWILPKERKHSACPMQGNLRREKKATKQPLYRYLPTDLSILVTAVGLNFFLLLRHISRQHKNVHLHWASNKLDKQYTWWLLCVPATWCGPVSSWPETPGKSMLPVESVVRLRIALFSCVIQGWGTADRN